MSSCQQHSAHRSIAHDKLGYDPRNDLTERQLAAQKVRNQSRSAATDAFETSPPILNGDKERFDELGIPGFAAFTKSLKHSDLGLVEPTSYETLLSAIKAGTQEAFECVQLGGSNRLLANPLNAYSYQLIGDDSNGVRMAPPPRFDSRNMAIDMVERYWMALCRDIRFDHYAHNELIAVACQDLNRLGFEHEFGFVCTPETIFRGAYEGCRVGPHVSQFLLQDFSFNHQIIHQSQKYPTPGLDYLTDLARWKRVNNGDEDPTGYDVIEGDRYLLTLRDAGQWVHVHGPHQSSFWPTIMLLEKCAKYSDAIPYVGDRITTADAFGSLGAPDIAIHAGLAGVYGLKHAWFQKWCVHNRLRPEAYAHRLELFRQGELASSDRTAANEVFSAPMFDQYFGDGANVWRETTVLSRIFEHNKQQNYQRDPNNKNGSWLLPVAYPEGSPIHPSYPGGHAVFIAAAATIAKAFFADGEFPNPKVPVDDGQRLDDLRGETLTIHGELNKLIANVTLFRDGAGMHWRTDGMATYVEARTGCHAIEGLETGGNLLGEQLAVSMLRDIRQTYRETIQAFDFKGLNEETIVVE